ncbi:MAG: hypothetical protein ACYTGX_14975 [Planctomycetota bacterium]|jgi:hypothetical protein
MQRIVSLVAVLAVAGCGSPEPPGGPEGSVSANARSAVADAAVESLEAADSADQCLGGCAAVPATVETASEADLARWLSAVQLQPPGTPSDALEQLMYYWRDAAPFVARQPDDAVVPEHRAYLTRELARDTVRVQARIVSTSGAIRVTYDKELFLGRRTHFEPDELVGVQLPEYSGTVQRVATARNLEDHRHHHRQHRRPHRDRARRTDARLARGARRLHREGLTCVPPPWLASSR